MSEMAKLIIAAGLALVALGALIAIVGKIPGVGKLPGDIFIKKDNFTFYFPLATCIFLSILLSLIMHFLQNRK